MAYYLGRDLDLALTTEHATKGLVVQESSTTGVIEVKIKNWADGLAGAVTYDSSDDKADLFAAPRRFGPSNSHTLFGDLIEMETEHSNPDNPDLSKFAEEYKEWSKDKVISKKMKGFNRLLRNYTWTIPYIGIHYQGGKSQKIEPMLR